MVEEGFQIAHQFPCFSLFSSSPFPEKKRERERAREQSKERKAAAASPPLSVSNDTIFSPHPTSDDALISAYLSGSQIPRARTTSSFAEARKDRSKSQGKKKTQRRWAERVFPLVAACVRRSNRLGDPAPLGSRTLSSLLWTHTSEKRALAPSSGGHLQIPGSILQSRGGGVWCLKKKLKETKK